MAIINCELSVRLSLLLLCAGCYDTKWLAVRDGGSMSPFDGDMIADLSQTRMIDGAMITDMRSLPPDLGPCSVVTRVLQAGEVLISCGTFSMGSDPGEDKAQPNEQPLFSTISQPFFMDQTEVTTKAYKECVAAGVCTAPKGQQEMNPNARCNWSTGTDTYPINCLDWNQANTYCGWRGKRLPTEIEWEYAARGNAHSIYPWGNAAPVTSGMDGGVAQACWNGANGSTCPVGQYEATLLGRNNVPGLFDLAGNVAEWTSSAGCSYPLPSATCDNTKYVFRGGSFYFLDPTLLRTAFRTMSAPDYWGIGIGFRCVRPAF